MLSANQCPVWACLWQSAGCSSLHLRPPVRGCRRWMSSAARLRRDSTPEVKEDHMNERQHVNQKVKTKLETGILLFCRKISTIKYLLWGEMHSKSRTINNKNMYFQFIPSPCLHLHYMPGCGWTNMITTKPNTIQCMITLHIFTPSVSPWHLSSNAQLSEFIASVTECLLDPSLSTDSRSNPQFDIDLI